jgi:tetratricopeptide (TPR) repeat protein
MIALQIRQHHLFIQDQGPPGATYLAVRAARRAIHADPDDARAYFLLGEAYWRLAFESGDRVGMAQLSQLENMRRIQAITAFNQSLLLQPEQVSAHERLAAIYQSMGYQDFRLKHMKEALKLHKAAGPRPGESPGQFKDRLTPMENAVTEVDKYVQKALDQYELKAANFKVIDRARQAAVRGLAAKALEVLEASDISAFAGEGMSMELDLFLSTGRVREVREWMVPAHEQDLGEERYATLQLLMFAATGDYDAADQELERLASAAGGVPPDGGPSPFRRHMATDLCRLILEGAIVDGSPLRALQKPMQEQRTGQLLHELVDRLRQQADYSVIRAVLAVEVGEDRKAEELLREYVEGMFVSEEAAASGAGLDFFGRPLGQRYLAFLIRSKMR